MHFSGHVEGLYLRQAGLECLDFHKMPRLLPKKNEVERTSG